MDTRLNTIRAQRPGIEYRTIRSEPQPVRAKDLVSMLDSSTACEGEVDRIGNKTLMVSIIMETFCQIQIRFVADHDLRP